MKDCLSALRITVLVTLGLGLASLSIAQKAAELPQTRPEVQKLLDRAALLSNEQKFAEAAKVCGEAADLAKTLRDVIGGAKSLQSQGVAYYRLGRTEEAITCFEKSRTAYQESGDKVSESSVLGNVALLHESLGHTEKAVQIYDEVLALQTKIGDRNGLAKTNLSVAVLYSSKDPAKSLEFGKKALDLFVDAADAQWAASTLMVLGGTHRKLGQFQKAQECLQSAVDLAHKGGYDALESDALSQLGTEFEDSVQYLKAFDCFDKSLQIARRLEDKQREGMRLTNLGIVADKIGQRRIAQGYFVQAIEISESTGDKMLRATAAQNLGASLHEDDKDGEAKKWLEQALTLSKEVGDRFGEAGCLGTLGNIAREAKEYDRAIELLKKSAAMFHDAKAVESEATALDSLGSVYFDQRKFEESVQEYDKAIKLYDGIGATSFAATSYGNKGQGLVRLERLDEAEKCFQEAIQRYEFIRSGLGGLSDAKSGYLKQRVHIYQQYANVLTLVRKPDAAFDVAQKTKARGLLDLLASGQLRVDDEMTAEERATEAELKKKADALNMRMVREGVENEIGAKARYAALSEELKKVEDDLNRFTIKLYSSHPGLAGKRVAETASAVEVGKALPDDTALIEFIVSDNEVVSLVLRKVNGVLTINGHSIPLDMADLKERCKQLQRACSSPTGDYKALAIDMYKDLMVPLAKDIAGKKRLIICPDACLWDLPFAVLMPGSSRYLIDDFEVDYAYSATGAMAALTTNESKTKAEKELLVCADPDFGSSQRFKDLAAAEVERPIDTPSRPIDQPSRPIDQPSRPIDQPSRAIDSVSRAIDSVSRAIDSVSRGMEAELGRGNAISPLPGTLKEAQTLAGLFPGSVVLTSTAAEESEVKQQAGKFRFIHFATHGFVNDASPLLSSIILSKPAKESKDDGFLTAREIHKLHLNAEMVVMSACNTARGEVRSGEGIIGLTWSLFVAGSQTQVVSQWSVDDTSTSSLMAGFYKDIKAATSGKGESLRTASLSLRSDAKYAHPYYWAPFILLGDWR